MANKRQVIAAAIVLAATLAAGGARAQQKEVTFAYQDMLDPIRTVQDTAALEKATGYKINWRQFGGGGDVIKAMASGDVQVGEAGSSPIAAAVSQGQELQLFWILDDIAAAEALIVRDGSGIKSMADLKGKKIATPFVSTSHYSLMVGMKLAGIDGREVNVMNLRPPEIAAAWERGDIDGAFIWDPVLSKIKGNGKEILTSGDVGKKGYPTFDGLVVNTKWANENKAFMVALVKLVAEADAQYRDHKAAWTVDSPQVKAIAKWSKADAKEIPASMALYQYPNLEQQASAVWLGGGAAKALKSTAEFLKEQGRVQELKPDYAAYVTTEYVKSAMGK